MTTVMTKLLLSLILVSTICGCSKSSEPCRDSGFDSGCDSADVVTDVGIDRATDRQIDTTPDVKNDLASV